MKKVNAHVDCIAIEDVAASVTILKKYSQKKINARQKRHTMYSTVKGNTLAGNKNNKSTPLSLSMEKALADWTHRRK